MKTIGMIGGTSWESTLEYYRIINETVREKKGNEHSARILMHSIDFIDVKNFIDKEDFQGLTSFMISLAVNLEKAGADCLLICANTIHMLADEVQNKISIPLIHIADATATVIKEKKITKIGLLGTNFTMEKEFYKGRMKDKHHIETIIPNEEDRNFIQHLIFDELFSGIKNPASKQHLLNIIDDLSKQGAEGIIMGCTELPLIVQQEDTLIPLFDTVEIHAKAAVDFALA
jgi:aspartate racemase